MISRFICLAVLCFGLNLVPAVATAQERNLPRGDQARLTVGVPVFVWHPRERPSQQDWNDGWFSNEGVLADVSWPVWKLGHSTRVRLGATGGVFENSIFRTSLFLGGMAEAETHVTPRLSFSLGTYAGAVTGYAVDLAPAAAPYIGTSYVLTRRMELGLRGFWLPAETFAGSKLAPSDAYIAAFTLGTRF